MYQKAYVEFFVSPDDMSLVTEVVSRRPDLVLYAITSAGNVSSTMAGEKGVTAVTWGVFPNREVIQPTVFDPETFVVWSKEAFELWTQAWAVLYDDASESSALLYEVYRPPLFF